jgi:hypothetical protein
VGGLNSPLLEGWLEETGCITIRNIFFASKKNAANFKELYFIPSLRAASAWQSIFFSRIFFLSEKNICES